MIHSIVYIKSHRLLAYNSGLRDKKVKKQLEQSIVRGVRGYVHDKQKY